MSVKFIIDATCDRCGKKCSSFIEKVVKMGEDFKVKTFDFNAYHYTELLLKHQDDRFEMGEDKFVLCGTCIDELGKWLCERKTEQCEKD